MTEACDGSCYTCPTFIHRRRHAYSKAVLILTILVLATVGFVVLKPARDDGPVIGVRDVMRHMDERLGQTVTVSGIVVDVLGPRTFTLRGELGIDDLVVVGGEDLPNVVAGTSLAKNDVVHVTGVVRRFDADAYQRDFGIASPDDDLDGRPTLVVQTVTPNTRQ